MNSQWMTLECAGDVSINGNVMYWCVLLVAATCSSSGGGDW